jgi:branched-subunit amino acid transport protein
VTAWLVICAVGLGTYAFRAVTFAIVSARGLPAWTERPLAFVGPAALGALVGGMLLTAHGSAEVPALAEAGAAVAAFVTVRRTGNVARGLVIGFPVLWALTWLGG